MITFLVGTDFICQCSLTLQGYVVFIKFQEQLIKAKAMDLDMSQTNLVGIVQGKVFWQYKTKNNFFNV